MARIGAPDETVANAAAAEWAGLTLTFTLKLLAAYQVQSWAI